jgi:hypothetical protein
LKSIGDKLREHLEDINAEENDMRYGYISGANTVRVPISNIENMSSGGLNLMSKFADGLMA